MFKALKILLGSLVLMVMGVVLWISLPWIILYVGIQSSPDPALPQITYGEFPFRLEYVSDGNPMVIEDTLICEYAGVGSNEGQGKYRKWKEKLASGNDNITLLKINEASEIYFSSGGAAYYMGDLPEGRSFKHAFPNAIMEIKDGRFTSTRFVSENELMEKFRIQLTRWEPAEPITNEFIKK